MRHQQAGAFICKIGEHTHVWDTAWSIGQSWAATEDQTKCSQPSLSQGQDRAICSCMVFCIGVCYGGNPCKHGEDIQTPHREAREITHPPMSVTEWVMVIPLVEQGNKVTLLVGLNEATILTTFPSSVAIALLITKSNSFFSCKAVSKII